MQGSTCPNCGAPLTPGATFCSFCGAAVTGGGAPLPASGASPGLSFPAGPAMPFETPPAPPRRRRTRLVVAVVLVVIVLIVAVIALAYILYPAPPIQVGAIDIFAPDDVCGLNDNPIYYDGFNGSTGAAQTLDFGIPNYNATNCTVTGVATNTSGFTLSQVQVPLQVPAAGNASMNITITSPSSDYTGDLNLIFS